MLYEILKIVVFVFGPLLIFSALSVAFQAPEMITSLPRAGRRAIEVLGVLFIVAAWFVTYVAPFGGAMAFIGLILLATPLLASKLSRFEVAYVEV
jgi:hypothetical protein